MRRIRRLLVANRSEIAIRVFRAATELGIETVAIFAEEDKLSLHRFKADEAYQVGAGKGALEGYLSIEEVIRVAKEANGRPVARVQDDPVADGDVLDGLGKEGIEVFLDPNLLIDRFSRIFNNVNKNNTANERSIRP